jgi:short-subunit dehydrogenase
MTQPPVKPLALILGAGSGAGGALALVLAGRGCDLLLVDPSGNRLVALHSECRAAGACASLFQGDLARREDRSDLLTFIRLADAKPDIIVFIAGGSLRDPGLAAPLAQVRCLEEGGLRALDELLRDALLPAMLREGNGYLLVLAPASHLHPTAGAVAGSAQGGGLRNYLAALRQGLRAKGLGVTLCACAGRFEASLCPGGQRPAPAPVHRVVRALFARQEVVGMPAWGGVALRMAGWPLAWAGSWLVKREHGDQVEPPSP